MFFHFMPLRRYNVKHKGDLDIQALPRLRSPVSTANEEAMEQCRHIRVHGCGNTQGAFVWKAWDTPLSDDPTAYSTRGAIFCKWYKMPTPPLPQLWEHTVCICYGLRLAVSHRAKNVFATWVFWMRMLGSTGEPQRVSTDFISSFQN